MSDSPTSRLPATIGRYTVTSVLGRGTMGVVYKAHDSVIGRPVAIKLVRADILDKQQRSTYIARFEREAKAAGRCLHPNIVTIYDFALYEGNPFLVMEYIEGVPLTQTLEPNGGLASSVAVAIMLQVLAALDCVHGFGIVHRDIKPANIMLRPDGLVKLTDFGVSHLDKSNATQAGWIVGTPSYMSPEQCRGEAIDIRSDVFSAGVVLYELLVGTKPFKGRSFTETAYDIQSRPTPDIRRVISGDLHGFAGVIERALAKQPDLRYGSANEMADALRAAHSATPAASAVTDQTVVAARAENSSARVPFNAALLAAVERRLAYHVGPLASRLVADAARDARSVMELIATLSERIREPHDRAAFITEFTQDGSPAPVSDSAGLPAVISPDEVARARVELAYFTGPIAAILVERALQQASSAGEFRQILAGHIKRPADREAFLQRRKG